MACSKSRVDLKIKNNKFRKALCFKVRLIGDEQVVEGDGGEAEARDAE